MILIPHENEDFNASISRGSFRVDGMVIILWSISCDGDILEMEIFYNPGANFRSVWHCKIICHLFPKSRLLKTHKKLYSYQ